MANDGTSFLDLDLPFGTVKIPGVVPTPTRQILTEQNPQPVQDDNKYEKDVLVISFPETAYKVIEDFLTTVPSAVVVYEKKYNEFAFLANKDDLNKFIIKQTQIEDIKTEQVKEGFVDALQGIHGDVDSLLEELKSLLRKINFAYLFFSGNFVGESKNGLEKTIQQIALKELTAIRNLTNEAEQHRRIDILLKKFPLTSDFWNSKINQYNDVIGVLKKSDKWRMDVILSDGSRTNLFDLDTSKPQTIMNTIRIPKIKKPFDFSNLCVIGNFICDHAKVQFKMPREIHGFLDFSYCSFLIESVPDGVTDIDFTNTLRSFKDLNQIEYPESLRSISVSRSLINKTTSDLEELESVTDFQTKHPKVIICDTKRTLSLYEVLQKEKEKIEQQKKQGVKQQDVIVTDKKPELPKKTDEWLTRKEIIDILNQDDQFANVDDLDRLVKRATKYYDTTTENRLVDGQQVLCVHVDNIEKVKNLISQFIEQDATRTKKSETKAKKTKSPQTTKDAEKPKTKKAKPRKFEKYIPVNIWKDICSSCNDSKHLLVSVLTEINKINTDYTKQHTRKEPVQYIDENGQMQSISTVNKREGCASVQHIDNKTKRIVWTINPSDRILVVIAFIGLSHDKSTRTTTSYINARTFAAKCQTLDGIPVTRNLIKQGGYLNVSDLLKKLADNNTNSEQDEKVVKETPTPQQPQEEKKDNEKDIDNQPKQNPVKSKRPRIKIQTATLVDLKAKEAENNAILQELKKQYNLLLIQLKIAKNDPKRASEVLRRMQDVVQKQIELTR